MTKKKTKNIKDIKLHPFSTSDPHLIKSIEDDDSFISEELYKVEPDGHKFSVNQELVLTGLVDFPEYNGTTVTITAIRKDDYYGKTYYIEGEINKLCNWVYEYRLKENN